MSSAKRAAHVSSVLVLLAAACKESSEPVGTDVCLSGRRWVGGNSRDVEMSPGTDCIGCHLDTDGPLLVAAGTVYATADNASQIANDCFGLEGVEVEIEAGDGRLWRTTTNRAGNFFFDGDPAWLVKPYVATLRYTTPDGRLIAPQMVTTLATYGGCARCHDGQATGTPALSSDDPDYVLPVNGLFVE
jgi:hypothetical protein